MPDKENPDEDSRLATIADEIDAVYRSAPRCNGERHIVHVDPRGGMKAIAPARGDPGKLETIRRLRYGDFLTLFRHRYGNELPQDDAGRDDLWLLVCNVSLAPSEPEKKVRHVIGLWAPWMSAEEREDYVKHVMGLDIYERIQTAAEIGQRVGLTNAEREALKLWRFKPIDMTDEELAEQAKARERERRARKRREKGIRTKAAYLAERARRPKPWIAQGISRRTWEPRRKRVTQGGSETSETCRKASPK